MRQQLENERDRVRVMEEERDQALIERREVEERVRVVEREAAERVSVVERGRGTEQKWKEMERGWNCSKLL